MKVEELLASIDISKTEKDYIDLQEMCIREFDIHEYVEQKKENTRLTYCYYHSWTCTDTRVGIRVWFFDGYPVCVSHKPYRKYDETFEWMSNDCFYKVMRFIDSLRKEGRNPENLISDEIISMVTEQYDEIEHKQFEHKKTLTNQL